MKTIGKHIVNVFLEGELLKDSTVANFATVQNEGGRNVERLIEYYNLDVIISVGYRVKSKQGTQFSPDSYREGDECFKRLFTKGICNKSTNESH